VPSHWTYAKEIPPDDELSQGDIIGREEGLIEALQPVHPYFCDTKYLCFIVTTQSCDLVLRDGASKAKHINLAVVRSLESLLPELLSEICDSDVPGVYSKKAKQDALEFLQRVINQNEQAHGMFYLHPDGDVGIAVESVALLRVSIALRSREHYNRLREARRGRLQTEFRNKLGWLAGNLYARVDTPDWEQKDGEKLVDRLLTGTGAQKTLWVPDSWLRAAKDQGLDLSTYTRDKVLSALEVVAPSPPIELGLEKIRSVGQVVQADLNEQQLNRIAEITEADQLLCSLAAQVAFTISHEVLGPAAAPLAVMLNDLPGAEDFRQAARGQVSRVVDQMKALRAKREVTKFFEILGKTPLLAAEGAEAVCRFVESILGAVLAAQRDDLRNRLESQPMTTAAIERVRGILFQAVSETLLEKAAGRLKNDVGFRALFREE
jgi:hypothetical protein